MDTQAFTGQHVRRARVSWAGIWAGLFAGLGIQIMLTSLGLGVGLTSSGTSATDYVKNLPMGVEVWTGLVWLFSAFLAGYVAAWMSGAYDRADGVFHGFATWGLMMTVLFCSATLMTGLMRIEQFAAFPLTPLLKASAWWMFVCGIISLGCAYLGGRIGVRAAEHDIEKTGTQRAA